MPFTLPPLPYAPDALEPHIDKMTMEIHHGRHHKAYVDNLNKALEGQSTLQSKSIDDLMRNLSAVPEAIRTTVRNNGGGHANHTMFWEIMGPGGGGEPTGEFAAATNAAFGSFDALKDAVNKAGAGRFGSGWAWLLVREGKLEVSSTPNQDNPLMDVAEVKGTPILGIDVWEHAYYLKYQNRRVDYLTAWWNVVNWTAVGARFE